MTTDTYTDGAVCLADGETSAQDLVRTGAWRAMLCGACASRYEAGRAVPGLVMVPCRLTRVCELSEGTCDGCSRLAGPMWDGLYLYAQSA